MTKIYIQNLFLSEMFSKTRTKPDNECCAQTQQDPTEVPRDLDWPQYSSSSNTGSIFCPHLPLYNSNSFSAGVTPAPKLKFTMNTKFNTSTSISRWYIEAEHISICLKNNLVRTVVKKLGKSLGVNVYNHFVFLSFFFCVKNQ